MAAHSRLGASSAKRWIECPGSFKLCNEDAVQRPGTSVYAAAGTVAHRIAEEALRHPDRELFAQEGMFVQQEGHEIVVDGEMLDAVWTYIKTVRASAAPLFTVTRHEQAVDLSAWWKGETAPPVRLFGTCDTWIYDSHRQHLRVVDFKFGAGVYVPVKDNPQLLYYAAGALLQAPGPVRTVTITVVQPRARGQDPVRSDRLDILDLRLWIDFVLKPAVAAVRDPDAPYATGSHCRFCAARPTCPAYADRAQASARDEFDVV